MEISVQSGELIEALSKRLVETIVELETTRLALKQSQEAIVTLEQQVIAMNDPAQISYSMPDAHAVL